MNSVWMLVSGFQVRRVGLKRDATSQRVMDLTDQSRTTHPQCPDPVFKFVFDSVGFASKGQDFSDGVEGQNRSFHRDKIQSHPSGVVADRRLAISLYLLAKLGWPDGRETFAREGV
jgi:hypothetical protein